MQIRTDLAVERREMAPESELRGIISREKQNESCRATIIEIISPEGEKALKKPMGKYITLEMDSFPDTSELFDGRFQMLLTSLEELIPKNGDILVAGLGNPFITPDAVGPECAKSVLATRHIGDSEKKELKLPSLRNVSVVSPGVTGKTGIETQEIILGVAEKIKPSALIVVDALAAGSVSRLARTIQLCDTGIEPGSGVRNSRKAIDKGLLGIPVVAVGVPTVVDAASLAMELTGQQIEKDFSRYADMVVAPRDTDIITSGASRLIALAINCALQKNLSKEEIISLTLP